MVIKLQAPDGSVVLLDSRQIKEMEIPATPQGAPPYFWIHTALGNKYTVQWGYAQEVENQMFADNGPAASAVK